MVTHLPADDRETTIEPLVDPTIQVCGDNVDDCVMASAHSQKRLIDVQRKINHLLLRRPKDDFSFSIRYPALLELEAQLIRTVDAQRPTVDTRSS